MVAVSFLNIIISNSIIPIIADTEDEVDDDMMMMSLKKCNNAMQNAVGFIYAQT